MSRTPSTLSQPYTDVPMPSGEPAVALRNDRMKKEVEKSMNRLPLDFVGTLMEALLIYFIYMVAHGRRHDHQVRPLRVVLFFLLFGTMNNLVGYFTPTGISSLLITVTAIGMVYGFLRANLLASVLIVVSSLILVMAIELPTVMVTVLLTGRTVEAVIAGDDTYVIVFAVAKTLQVIAGYLLYRSRISLERLRPFRREASLISNLLIQTCLVGLIVYIALSGSATGEHQTLYAVFSYGGILMLFAFGVLDLLERNRAVSIMADYQVKDTQIQQMKEATAVIRREKHDFANHIATIQGIVSMKRPNALDAIGAYLESVGIELQRTFRSFDTGNDYIDGLLALKHHKAQEQGIDLQVDVAAPFNLLRVPRTELISVVSNLVDNAFDSFAGMEVDGPVVQVETRLEGGQFLLFVRDNGKQIPMEISERIFQEGFSTKMKPEGERGYGLAITRRIIEQHRGTIQVVSSQRETEFQIVLPAVEKKAAI